MESLKEVYDAQSVSYGAVRAVATDQPSSGDATRHHYRITHSPSPGGPEIDLGLLKFQEGVPAIVGVNGVTDEAVLSVVADHIEGFAKGPCNCNANQQAAWLIRDALRWLKTRDASQRGAMGASK